jgi:hypothetical protein
MEATITAPAERLVTVTMTESEARFLRRVHGAINEVSAAKLVTDWKWHQRIMEDAPEYGTPERDDLATQGAPSSRFYNALYEALS